MSFFELLIILDIILNGIFLCYTGQHAGAGLWYFYFTLIPGIIMYICYRLSCIHNKYINSIGITILLLFCGYRLYEISPKSDDIGKWNNNLQAYEQMQKFDIDKDIYLSPVLVGYAIDNKYYNFDYGDTRYIPESDSPLIDNFSLMKKNKYVHDKYTSYWDQLIEGVEEKKYSLIVLDNIDCAMSESYRKDLYDAIEGNYTAVSKEKYYSERIEYELTYYIP